MTDAVLNLLSEILWGGVYLLLEGLLTIIESIVSAVDLGTLITSTAASWNVLPPTLIYLINSMGIPDALSVIGWAYTVRFVLNIIPASLTRI